MQPKIQRIVDDERELLSFFRAKVNSVHLAYDRGYFLPNSELKFINKTRKISSKGKSIVRSSKKAYTIEDFKDDINQDKLLDQYYFRFLNAESVKDIDKTNIFRFKEAEDGWLEVERKQTPAVMTTGNKQNKTMEDFGHVQTEKGRIYASLDIYKKQMDREFEILVIRFPKPSTSKKTGKTEAPNAVTIQNANKRIPYYLNIQRIYVLRVKLSSPGAVTANQDQKLEIFVYDDLIINKTQHFLVPKHILLPRNEADKIKQVFGAAYLSKISYKDPIAKYYNAKIGDVFMILRQELVIYGSVLEKEHFRVVIYDD